MKHLISKVIKEDAIVDASKEITDLYFKIASDKIFNRRCVSHHSEIERLLKIGRKTIAESNLDSKDINLLDSKSNTELSWFFRDVHIAKLKTDDHLRK